MSNEETVVVLRREEGVAGKAAFLEEREAKAMAFVIVDNEICCMVVQRPMNICGGGDLPKFVRRESGQCATKVSLKNRSSPRKNESQSVAGNGAYAVQENLTKTC